MSQQTIDIFANLKQSLSVQEPVDLQRVPAEERGQTTEPKDVRVIEMPIPVLKGQPVRVFSNQTANITLSGKTVDCTNWNAVHIQVWAYGSSPSCVLTVQGATESENYITLPDPNATKTVTATTSYVVEVGTHRVKLALSSISGADTAFTVVATPFAGFATTVAAALYGKQTNPGDTALVVGSHGVLTALTDANTVVELPVYRNQDQIGTFGLQGTYLCAGSTLWDREYANVDVACLATQAGSLATRTSPDQTCQNHRGLALHVNCANRVGVATITPAVQRKAQSGAYVTIWTAAAAISANGDYDYLLYPGVGYYGATEYKSLALSRTFRVVLTYAGNGTTDAFDTEADYSLIR